MIKTLFSLSVFFTAVFFGFSAYTLEDGVSGHSAVLGGLNKGTARVNEFSLGVGSVVRFGRLEITLLGCEHNSPISPPESVTFLEIVEKNFKGEKSVIFRGWMFASTPTLNALDHPLYDIWVIECISGD